MTLCPNGLLLSAFITCSGGSGSVSDLIEQEICHITRWSPVCCPASDLLLWLQWTFEVARVVVVPVMVWRVLVVFRGHWWGSWWFSGASDEVSWACELWTHCAVVEVLHCRTVSRLNFTNQTNCCWVWAKGQFGCVHTKDTYAFTCCHHGLKQELLAAHWLNQVSWFGLI